MFDLARGYSTLCNNYVYTRRVDFTVQVGRRYHKASQVHMQSICKLQSEKSAFLLVFSHLSEIICTQLVVLQGHLHIRCRKHWVLSRANMKVTHKKVQFLHSRFVLFCFCFRSTFCCSSVTAKWTQLEMNSTLSPILKSPSKTRSI